MCPIGTDTCNIFKISSLNRQYYSNEPERHLKYHFRYRDLIGFFKISKLILVTLYHFKYLISNY